MGGKKGFYSGQQLGQEMSRTAYELVTNHCENGHVVGGQKPACLTILFGFKISIPSYLSFSVRDY
jgi:hypothetical protein